MSLLQRARSSHSDYVAKRLHKAKCLSHDERRNSEGTCNNSLASYPSFSLNSRFYFPQLIAIQCGLIYVFFSYFCRFSNPSNIQFICLGDARNWKISKLSKTSLIVLKQQRIFWCSVALGSRFLREYPISGRKTDFTPNWMRYIN